MDHLPYQIYHDEEHVRDFQQAVGKQVRAFQEARDDLLLQLKPATATSWGLTRYEDEYGVTLDVRKPLPQRLSLWRAKRRGAGTTTKEMLMRVVKSITNGDVEVFEYPGDDYLEIYFTCNLDNPPNLRDLRNIVEEIIPAHLGYGTRETISLPTPVHIYAHPSTLSRISVLPLFVEPEPSEARVIVGAAAHYAHKIKVQPKGIA